VDPPLSQTRFPLKHATLTSGTRTFSRAAAVDAPAAKRACIDDMMEVPLLVKRRAHPAHTLGLARPERAPTQFAWCTDRRCSESARLPVRGSRLAAGYDLMSAYDTIVPARGKQLVKTDLEMAIPDGCYGRIAPRSGLAWKNFIDTGAGVIDADYRGNVGVILFNHSETDFNGGATRQNRPHEPRRHWEPCGKRLTRLSALHCVRQSRWATAWRSSCSSASTRPRCARSRASTRPRAVRRLASPSRARAPARWPLAVLRRWGFAHSPKHVPHASLAGEGGFGSTGVSKVIDSTAPVADKENAPNER
jgi:deoxyuridine 5'-triphosphate nucleotidohydrolase